MKITEFVRTGNRAYFTRYRAGFLYYRIVNKETSELYEFPVECADLAGATVNEEETSLTMMRYIRLALANGQLDKVKED